MRTNSFIKVSASEAQEVLRQFLEDGIKNTDIVRAHAEAAGVNCDYSIESLPAFLRWAFSQMRTVPRETDLNVPEWIRSTADYQKGLFEFEDRSKDLICFVAYYFGECFIRHFPQLKWATGNCDSSDGYINRVANMPVVVGFKYEKEFPPLLVTENLFRGLVKRGNIEDFQNVVDAWQENAR